MLWVFIPTHSTGIYNQGTLLPEIYSFPSNQSGECRNAAALWPLAAIAALKPVLKLNSYSQGLQGYK